MPEALLISVPQAAARLGIGKNRCYTWVRRKILPSARDAGRIYIPARAVDKLVERIEAGQWSPGQ